ncbi:hypothetical protein DRQ32_11760, partial [bacterium]
MNLYLALPGVAALIALLFAVLKFVSIMRQDAGTEQMQAISRQVQEGAAAFLNAEYRWLAVFVTI